MARVDLHTHLLPDVDDGPKVMADSIRMARLASADGTTVIVATPHQRDVMMGPGVDRVRDLVAQLNSNLRSEPGANQRPPRILLGMENHVEPELPEWFDQGIALPINGTKFILCEPPFTLYPDFMDDVLFSLQVRRLAPIVAHPERNAELQRRPKRLGKLVERGMLAQITGASLLGEFGGAARKTAEYFVQHGLAHFIASDMHRPTETRTPQLAAAYRRVLELVSEEKASALFQESPTQVVNGRDPEIETPRFQISERRKWWWPFRARDEWT